MADWRNCRLRNIQTAELAELNNSTFPVCNTSLLSKCKLFIYKLTLPASVGLSKAHKTI